MEDGLQIAVHNYSSIRWTRNIWTVGAGTNEGVNWTDEVTQTPLETIEPHNGGTTAAAGTAHLGFLVKDGLWIRLGYTSDQGSFAVEVKQFFHLFGIGGQDQWRYLDKDWSSRTTDTSPHKWTFATCTVLATPKLSDSSGLIDILISDIPKRP